MTKVSKFDRRQQAQVLPAASLGDSGQTEPVFLIFVEPRYIQGGGGLQGC